MNELQTDYLGYESMAAMLGDDSDDSDDNETDHHSLPSESNSSSVAFTAKDTTTTTTTTASFTVEASKETRGKSASISELKPSLPILLDFSSGSAISTNSHTPIDPYNQQRITRKRKSSRWAGGQAREGHLMAERMRREKLSQKFIALSALIPGLKRADKTSVLIEAINCIKQQQKRLEILEQENARRDAKKSKALADDEDGNSYSCSQETSIVKEKLPEIEAKFCGKRVLIRIHCEKQKGVVARLLTQTEKLNLVVGSVNAVPFSDSVLHITIIAEMELEFNMTPSGLAELLHSALRRF